MLADRYVSDLFKRIWISMLKAESKSKLTVTFTDVVIRIWNPVFTQCCQLVESVQSRKIKLRDVDIYFRDYEGEHIISEHLRNLFSAIETCYGRPVVTTGWIQASVHLMQQYWALCDQAKAANIILELKESLNLKGNFDIIENVASQVTESMKDSSLDRIDGNLMEAKSFLEQMTADSKKLECLHEFAACSSIVEWIRKETTGV